ncbi:MAG: alpha/beta hydrolase [Nevskiales bacterium]
MIKTLLLVAALYGIVVLLAWLVSDRMIFLPPPASYDERQLPIVRVNTDDGNAVAVLHLPNPDATFTLLFSHGNAEDLGYLAPFLMELRDAGFAVLAYDYRGYGLSTGGLPSTAGSYRDEHAVYQYATQTLKIPPARIILHGRSVGSGPAVDLATREAVGGLIVESGFVSVYRVLTRWPLLAFDKFPNLKNIRKVRCPVLVIHGRQDEIIPFWHGQKLFAAAPDPKRALWVDEAGHNDLAAVAWDQYVQALQDFAQTVAGPKNRPATPQ